MERNRLIDEPFSELIRLTKDLVSEAKRAEKKLASLSEERIITFLKNKGETVYWVDFSLEVRLEPEEEYRKVKSIRLKNDDLFVVFTDGVCKRFSRVYKSDAVRILKLINACEENYVRKYRVTVSEANDIISSNSQSFPTWEEAYEEYQKKVAEISEKYPDMPGQTKTEEKDEYTRIFTIKKKSGVSYTCVTLDACYVRKN